MVKVSRVNENCLNTTRNLRRERVKSTKWLILVLLLGFTAFGCYWAVPDSGVEMILSVPKELLAKAPPDLYTVTIKFEEAELIGDVWQTKENGLVYDDTAAVPAFELISRGVLSIKMNSGDYMLTIEFVSESGGPKYIAGPEHVEVPVFSRVKVDMTVAEVAPGPPIS